VRLPPKIAVTCRAALSSGQLHLVGPFFDFASARVLRVSATDVREFDTAEVTA